MQTETNIATTGVTSLLNLAQRLSKLDKPATKLIYLLGIAAAFKFLEEQPIGNRKTSEDNYYRLADFVEKEWK